MRNATITVMLDPGLDEVEARDEIRSLLAWRPVALDRRVLEAAWRVQDRYKVAWWDSLIIAAAGAAGSRFLLTEDLQHQQEFGNLKVVSPFQSTPEELTAK